MLADGYVVYCEAPSPQHQLAARRLANLIERAARAAVSQAGDCRTVNIDVDLRLRDIPLLNRRPDVVLYRRLDDGERLRAEHAQLVAEIVSPASGTTDEVDKLGDEPLAPRARSCRGSPGGFRASRLASAP